MFLSCVGLFVVLALALPGSMLKKADGFSLLTLTEILSRRLKKFTQDPLFKTIANHLPNVTYQLTGRQTCARVLEHLPCISWYTHTYICVYVYIDRYRSIRTQSGRADITDSDVEIVERSGDYTSSLLFSTLVFSIWTVNVSLYASSSSLLFSTPVFSIWTVNVSLYAATRFQSLLRNHASVYTSVCRACPCSS